MAVWLSSAAEGDGEPAVRGGAAARAARRRGARHLDAHLPTRHDRHRPPPRPAQTGRRQRDHGLCDVPLHHVCSVWLEFLKFVSEWYFSEKQRVVMVPFPYAGQQGIECSILSIQIR